ncbi:GNAT family N-acetyltransferase [Lewinella sp. 4G2]|uniref:GNAT family N-acetyltransferase n=1 Tax=Lewinella sp. 4G2 TaxID=1803372 RepID=UPI0007B4CE30|nr:GNAT family N-acetyltransferase [Lewinella sp. 4G2]OAV43771.1 hypothetical protein A3850_004340 [Lewinella sp. 4G2]
MTNRDYQGTDFEDNLFRGEAWARAVTAPYGLDLRWAEGWSATAPPLPYVLRKSLGGTRVLALPFSDYLPLKNASEVSQLAQYLRDVHPEAAITIKTELPNDTELAGARVVRTAVLHTITPDGPGPNGKFRANARRATRDGVTVRKATDEGALERFYAMYANLRTRKFRSIPQPYVFFKSIFDAFIATGRGYLVEALYEGRMIASFVILLTGKRAFHKFSASSLDTLVPRPNNLIFSFLHEELAAGRIESLDLGLSGLSEKYAGLRYFKSTAGGVESPLTYYEWMPAGFDVAAEKQFKEHLGELTKKMVNANLTPEQLSSLSLVIYPNFA